MNEINIFVLILINTISTLILGGCTSYSNVNERDLRFRGDNIYDLVYLKNSNTPYTGKVSSFYENGDKKKTENYRKGKLHQLSLAGTTMVKLHGSHTSKEAKEMDLTRNGIITGN